MMACSREGANGLADVSAVAVGSAIAPVYKGYQIATGTDYKRRMLKPDVYRLRGGVYVLSDEGGWFSEGRARYGGGGRGGHICLSAWVVDLSSEKVDSDGRIMLTEQNLDQLFWETHDPTSLEQVPFSDRVSLAKEYFYMKDLTPYLSLFVNGRRIELMLKQD
jgi:hypothetical protein